MNKIRKQTSLLKQKAYLVFFYLPLLTWFSLIATSSPSFAAMDSSTKQIEGVICFPDPVRKECYCDPCARMEETLKETVQKANSSVNTVMREYNRDHTDLSVKVPGGMLETKRWYYGNTWKWEHIRHNLKFNMDSLGTGIKSIDKGGVIYEVSLTNADIYKNDTYQITKNENGYRWEDKQGAWKEFDTDGRMTSYGTRTGVIGKPLYEDGKLIGLADRNDTQVIWYEYNGDLISAVSDADSRRVEYGYTGERLSAVTDTLGNNTIYEYNGEGRITKTVDAESRESNVTYDGYGNVSSVVDNNGIGHFFVFGYDEGTKETNVHITTSSGKIKEVWYDRDGETKRVDVNGRTLQTIAKDGRDLIITDEKGNITRKEYDEWDNLTKVIYADGSEALFEYDLRFNKVSRVTDQLENVTQYQYDEHGNLAEKTRAVGTDDEGVTTYTYDGDNQLLTATVEADGETPAATTTFTYDNSGNIATVTGPEGNTTQFLEYDNMGNPVKIKDPRENEWNFQYDATGRVVSQTDPLNHTTAYEYDGANNRTAVINAHLKRFEFEYDDHNNLIRAIDPYSKFIETSYNTDSLPTGITDQEGKGSGIVYDNEGRLIKTIDGAGNEIVYHYDETLATYVSSYKPVQIVYPTYTRTLYYDRLGRVLKEIDDLGTDQHSKDYVYDAAGNVISVTDEKINTTQFEYDALNRLVKTTDPMGGEIKRSYDDRGNLISIEDPNSGKTYYDYDRGNRLIKLIRPMLQETTYEYDASGNRTAVVDTKGQRIEYDYNAINRLTQVRHYASGNHSTPVKTVNFTYDALGNILTYNDGTTSSVYTYDDLSRKTSEEIDYGSFSLGYDYEYFANGLKKTFTGPDGETIEYSYDENNRTAGITVPGQGQITYNTYQWNSPTRVTLPGGSTTDYTYDPLMRLKTLTAKDPGQNPVVTRDYTYSPASNITAKNTEHGNYTYQYDNLYRLTGATNPTVADEEYTYDPLGNRLTSANTTGSWSYNTNNELTGYDDVSYVYDDNGNTTNKTNGTNETKYIYDTEDRLTEARDGADALIASYYYDPFGRRLWKDVDGTRTYFLYSDEGLIGEYDSTGTEIKTYGWAPGSQWSTDPLFQKSAGIYFWYRNDHLGTPQKITRTNGSVAWSATYDSFGNVQIDVQDITNNLRFAGQYFDAETGLYYNLNRYYDSTIGRYLRTDPFGQGLNLYSYVFNNPNGLIDPLGLCAVKKGWNWFLTHPLSSVADWWNNYAAQTSLVLESMVYSNGDLWWLAASIQTAVDVGSGFVDILRFGEGFAEGGWGYAQDALRGLAIYGALSQAAKALPGALRATKGSRSFSAIKPGPLPADIAETFAGGRYTQRVLQQDTIFYRVHGGKAGPIGRRGTFVSSNPQTGGLQSQIDLALKPEWGNTATKVSRIKVPAGTTIYEGIASSQGGAWVGGTPQVFIPKVSSGGVLP